MQIYIVYKETWLIDGPGVHDMRPFLDESIARHHFIAEKEKLEKNGWVLEKELGNLDSFVFIDSSCTTEDNGAFLGLYMKKLELKGEKYGYQKHSNCTEIAQYLEYDKRI